MKTPKKQPVEMQTYQFSSLPSLGDKILIFTRSHVFYLWIKIFLYIMSSIISMSATLILFFAIYPSFKLFLITQFLIITCNLTLCLNAFLGWYFHFYLVTKRKIVEVYNMPFGKYFINEIMLDRVKCTEVDISSNGLVNQLLRIGDVIVTFDRPTKHRESFIFNNVSNANSIREILTDYFSDDVKDSATWYVFDRQKQGLVYPVEDLKIQKLHA